MNNEYATNINNNFLPNNYTPLMVYNNALLSKKEIFKDNKDKQVIYRWVNNLNGKTYIGSTINFNSRFYKYYNTEYLKSHVTPLHNALLNHDFSNFSNFSLEIVEYCNKENAIIREQFYIDLLIPEYNILQKAGSSLGYKHTEETIKYFKEIRKLSTQAKEKLSFAASNRTLSNLEKIKLSDIRKGMKLSDETKRKISSTITSMIGVPISIKDTNTNIEKQYINLTEAEKDIGISRTAIKKACDTGNIKKNRYYVKKK